MISRIKRIVANLALLIVLWLGSWSVLGLSPSSQKEAAIFGIGLCLGYALTFLVNLPSYGAVDVKK